MKYVLGTCVVPGERDRFSVVASVVGLWFIEPGLGLADRVLMEEERDIDIERFVLLACGGDKQLQKKYRRNGRRAFSVPGVGALPLRSWL